MGATLVLCKPDAVERGLVGEILSRFERKGLRIAAARLLQIDVDLAARHYAEHTNKPFYPELRDFIGRSPTLALVLEGPEETYAIVRTLMGPTNPAGAPPGTIRGDFGLEVTENLVHGSDSEASA
ncbi:MAG: nucleoside-diphosphate kinase, partial [Acidimicrobiia bacterium]|nr:nucleoside-diphosphate kinase [Acidimicrobiia bacterium]